MDGLDVWDPVHSLALITGGLFAGVLLYTATIALLVHAPSALLVAALLAMAPILPLSLGLMVPLNAKLKDPALSPESAEPTALLERWGRLHRVRATFAIGRLRPARARLRSCHLHRERAARRVRAPRRGPVGQRDHGSGHPPVLGRPRGTASR